MNATLRDLVARLDRLEREIASERTASSGASQASAVQFSRGDFSRGELKMIDCLHGAGKSLDAAAAFVVARRGAPPTLSNPLRR